MTPPYSLEQAKYLSSLYQRLVGSKFNGNNSVVEDVMIVPFDQASKQRFSLYYMVMAQDAQDIVLQEYKGFLFDIYVSLRSASGDIQHRELSSFLRSEIAEENEKYGKQTMPGNAVFFTDSLS